MQCQLLFVEMFSLAEFFSPLLLVSILEGCGVFLTCGLLCSWGRAWGSEFLLGPPQLFCCCTFGQKSVGTGRSRVSGCAGLVWRAARYLCCTSSLTFLDEPQGARDGLKGMFQALQGALFFFFCLQVLSVKSALTLW